MDIQYIWFWVIAAIIIGAAFMAAYLLASMRPVMVKKRQEGQREG